MKHEVFILGGQRIYQKSTLRKGAIVSSSPQGMTSWNSSIKNWFFSMHLKKKICHGVKQYATRRSVEHCTPHADGAWLNELGWSQ